MLLIDLTNKNNKEVTNTVAIEVVPRFKASLNLATVFLFLDKKGRDIDEETNKFGI